MRMEKSDRKDEMAYQRQPVHQRLPGLRSAEQPMAIMNVAGNYFSTYEITISGG